MVVACVAVLLAMTGSAFAARSLITGADIKDGSITPADLSSNALSATASASRARRGKRGPAGHPGEDGFIGPKGPQGSTGDTGPRGLIGPAGPQGQKGTTGDTGRIGPQGPQGVEGPVGPQGPQGPAGQPIVFQTTAPCPGCGTLDAGTPLGLTAGFTSSTDGVEISNGGTFLDQAFVPYKVEVFVSFVDPNPTDARAEYGVARLFLGDTGLDGVNATPNGGNSDADTLLVTPDVPDDGTNAAQASATFIVTPGGGGEQLTLRGAVRTAEPDGSNVTGHIVVTRLG